MAIARAMIKNPRLLLCDELTGALDTRSSKQVLKFVEKMTGQFGTTVVIIMHNEAIAGMADRIVRLKDGRICENRMNERNKIEDAHFTTYMEIPDEELRELADTYHVALEEQRYINMETDDVTARVFGRTQDIDLYEITQGKDVAYDDEIDISEGYAVENNINIGGSMKIGDKEYTVAGFMQRPDYGSDIIGLNQKEPNSKGDAEFNPVLILS